MINATSGANSLEALALAGRRPRTAFVDLGDITGSRAVEMYLPLWLRLLGTFETPRVTVRVVKE